MESRESMIPSLHTRAPETPSNYQLSLKTESPTQTATGNPSQMMMVPVQLPPGVSPATSGMSSTLEKKKRGRPRKYGPDGVAVSIGASGRPFSPMPLSSASSPTSGGYSNIKFGEAATSGGEVQAEKKRRRRRKSDMNLGDEITYGGSFTPHMVTVNPGEDVTSKIISFSKNGPRAICVLSALGIISHVTLRQPSSSGGTVTYEGRFEILSLSGSFTPGEVGGMSSREGGMSITLSSPDGRVVGGLLGGPITAAGPVQVVVASFLPEIGNSVGPKPRKQKNIIKLSTPISDPTVSRTTNMDQQNFNEQSHESPSTGNPNSTPPPNFQPENRTSMPPVHDWRRTTTDMNLSLRED